VTTLLRATAGGKVGQRPCVAYPGATATFMTQNGTPEDRLVLFLNTAVAFAIPLAAAVLRATTPGLRVVAICDTRRRGFWRRAVCAGAVGRLRAQAAARGIPFLQIPGPLLHTCKALSRIRAHRPTAALAIGCLVRFRPSLLELFEVAANYHNGLLPLRRGLRATAWSLYEGDPVSGFSFHRMTAQWDDGPVLQDGRVTVTSACGEAEVEAEKTRLAAEAVPHLLEQLVRREPGRAQVGESRYRSRADTHGVCRVRDVASVTWPDLERRLRAFGLLRIRLHGVWWPVAEVAPGRGLLSFRTADGATGHVARLTRASRRRMAEGSA
jgi:methionyl-tRNA formyltransferase